MGRTHDGGDYPHDDDEAADDVGGGPEGGHQRGADVGDLGPIKGDGEQAEAGAHAELHRGVRHSAMIRVLGSHKPGWRRRRSRAQTKS